MVYQLQVCNIVVQQLYLLCCSHKCCHLSPCSGYYNAIDLYSLCCTFHPPGLFIPELKAYTSLFPSAILPYPLSTHLFSVFIDLFLAFWFFCLFVLDSQIQYLSISVSFSRILFRSTMLLQMARSQFSL